MAEEGGKHRELAYLSSRGVCTPVPDTGHVITQGITNRLSNYVVFIL